MPYKRKFSIQVPEFQKAQTLEELRAMIAAFLRDLIQRLNIEFEEIERGK